MPKNKSHYRVSLSDAINAHEEALRLGGRNGIRDLTLLQSAIGRPYTGYYRFIYQKAAALLHSLAANHGFVDGNKRTALLTLHILLDRSGYTINAANDDALQHDLETLILDVVMRQIDYEGLVAWMKARVRRK